MTAKPARSYARLANEQLCTTLPKTTGCSKESNVHFLHTVSVRPLHAFGLPFSHKRQSHPEHPRQAKGAESPAPRSKPNSVLSASTNLSIKAIDQTLPELEGLSPHLPWLAQVAQAAWRLFEVHPHLAKFSNRIFPGLQTAPNPKASSALRHAATRSSGMAVSRSLAVFKQGFLAVVPSSRAPHEAMLLRLDVGKQRQGLRRRHNGKGAFRTKTL